MSGVMYLPNKWLQVFFVICPVLTCVWHSGASTLFLSMDLLIPLQLFTRFPFGYSASEPFLWTPPMPLRNTLPPVPTRIFKFHLYWFLVTVLHPHTATLPTRPWMSPSSQTVSTGARYPGIYCPQELSSSINPRSSLLTWQQCLPIHNLGTGLVPLLMSLPCPEDCRYMTRWAQGGTWQSLELVTRSSF